MKSLVPSTSNQKSQTEENQHPSSTTKKRNIIREKSRAPYVPPIGLLPYVPKHFIFYGSLTDPTQLQNILKLPITSILKPAKVRSYEIMLWGQYPALVDGPRNSYVERMAYLIETEQQQKLLEYYETEMYNVRGVRVEVDGERVSGRAFMWADSGHKELIEGDWSLARWKRELEEEKLSHFQPYQD